MDRATGYKESEFRLCGSIKDVELDVRVHNSGNRVSLICKGKNWFSFKLDHETE